MTCIVWDGKTLAADGQMIFNGTKVQSPKLYRLPDGSLFGGAGDTDAINRMLSYLRTGKRKPKSLKEFEGIQVMPSGEVRLYAESAEYDLVSDRFVAIGTGAGFAFGALECGKGAVQAVEIACRRDANSGFPVDSLSLAPPSDPPRQA